MFWEPIVLVCSYVLDKVMVVHGVCPLLYLSLSLGYLPILVSGSYGLGSDRTFGTRVP